MLSKTYTLDEIRDLWDLYNNTKVARIFKDGKWEIVPPDSIRGGLINATKAEYCLAKMAQSFPEFVEAR